MKKRLLFVINTLSRAGAENALMELLKKLNGQEYEDRKSTRLNSSHP